MGRNLIVLTLLVLFIAGSFLTAFAAVHSQQDNVQFMETVLYGDPAAACGLEIDYQTTYDYYLTWDTDWTIGTDKAETEYVFSQDRSSSAYPTQYGVTMERGNYTSSYMKEERVLKKLYDEMLAAGSPGETVKRTIRLADYTDFYPLRITIELPGQPHWFFDERTSSGLSPSEAEIFGAFRSYFRIPVDPDETLGVEMAMNSTGDDYSMLSHYSTDSTCRMTSLSAVASDACYFTFNMRSNNDTAIDTRLLPKGYGIFCLPYSEKGIQAKKLFTVYPLEPGTIVSSLSLSPDEKHLYLFTEEKGRFWFYSIGRDTMETEQKLEMPGSCDIGDLCIGEEYFAGYFYNEGGVSTIAVYEKDGDGQFRSVLSVPYTGAQEEAWSLLLYDDTTMAYDGEKLAITGKITEPSGYYLQCGFRLSIFDYSGLLYCGDYLTGQNPGTNYSQGNYECSPLHGKLPDIRWAS